MGKCTLEGAPLRRAHNASVADISRTQLLSAGLEHFLTVQEGIQRLRTLTELGSGVLMKAEVADTSRIYVHVGMGFYAECSLPEALGVAQLRCTALQGKVGVLMPFDVASYAFVLATCNNSTAALFTLLATVSWVEALLACRAELW